MVVSVGDDVVVGDRVGRVVAVSYGAEIARSVPRQDVDAWVARVRSAWGEHWRSMYCEIDVVFDGGSCRQVTSRDIQEVRPSRRAR